MMENPHFYESVKHKPEEKTESESDNSQEREKNEGEESEEDDKEALTFNIRLKNHEGQTVSFQVISNVPDGNCMFRALSQALCDSQDFHEEIRRNIVNHITSQHNWKRYHDFIRFQHSSNGESLEEKVFSNPLPEDRNEVEIGSNSSDGKPIPLNPSDSGVPQGISEGGARIDVNYNSKQEAFPSNASPITEFPAISEEREEIKTTDMNSNEKEFIMDSMILPDADLSVNGLQDQDEDPDAAFKSLYEKYMSQDQVYGTLQEFLAASELYRFNLVIMRETGTGNDVRYNVQDYQDQTFDVTHYFLFTGDAEEGHFELMLPNSPELDVEPMKIMKGNYKVSAINEYEGYIEIDHDLDYPNTTTPSISITSVPSLEIRRRTLSMTLVDGMGGRSSSDIRSDVSDSYSYSDRQSTSSTVTQIYRNSSQPIRVKSSGTLFSIFARDNKTHPLVKKDNTSYSRLHSPSSHLDSGSKLRRRLRGIMQSIRLGFYNTRRCFKSLFCFSNSTNYSH